MLSSKAAQRYALALLKSAEQEQQLEQTLKDVSFIQRTLQDSRELRLFLKSPIIKPEQKVDALNTLFKGKIGDLAYAFILLVARKKRVELLAPIFVSVLEQYKVMAGIKDVEIRTARELDDEQAAGLKASLEAYTGKKVNLTINLLPELKGGLAVKIDDTIIDGTIKHKLEQLEQKFVQTAAV